ncbi:hypothetical protein U0070_017317 [Myodes glareolus]|uniref:Dynein heavy chain 3, axonemal n=1 Tax=Myodes glareolus TaxID=447135 RepID=A0AAW0K3G5_MYOGA
MSYHDCSSQELDKNDSIHHMSHSQARPELPPLPVSANEEPSELYETVMSHSFYPPLMQRTSWTLAVPFKEQDCHRGPSDSIGNNYSLTARDMKLKDLLKVYQPVTINVPRDKTSKVSKVSSEPTKKKMKLSLKCKEDAPRMPPACKLSSSATRKSDRDSWAVQSGSRPMSPEQQMDVMLQEEMEIESKEKKPSELDLERYYYYLTNGIRKDMIAPEDEEVMVRIYKLIPKVLLATPALEPLQVALRSEKERDYYYSLMKSIGKAGLVGTELLWRAQPFLCARCSAVAVTRQPESMSSEEEWFILSCGFTGLRTRSVDYILMDPMEKKRLFIESIPRLFPHRVIRAPVPWHNVYQSAKKWNEEHLHTVNPMMYNLKELWFAEFKDLRFVRTADLLAGKLPLLPNEYQDVIQKHCQEARQILLSKWIPTCAQLFISQKEHWVRFAPKSDYDSSRNIEEYFASVASFMSLQLRELVIKSLEDLVSFFMIHKDGNDFKEPYQEMDFFTPQLIMIQLEVHEPIIVFNPTFDDCWELIKNSFLEIIKNSDGIPKNGSVNKQLGMERLPELQTAQQELVLEGVDYNAKMTPSRVESILFPELKGYNLILGTVNPEENLVSDFVNDTFEVFKKNQVGPHKYLNVYRKYEDLLDNTAEQGITEFLNKNHEIEDFVTSINLIKKRRNEIASMHTTVPLAIICNQYNTIAEKVSEIPANTAELVALIEYLRKSSDVTVFKLRRQLRDASERLEFLMDYADLPHDDIKLNSTLFLWPDQIEDVFENSRNLLLSKRDQAEMDLIKRCSEFESRLEGYGKELETFRKREVMTTEEMKNNVEKLHELSKNLDLALTEFEVWNLVMGTWDSKVWSMFNYLFHMVFTFLSGVWKS